MPRVVSLIASATEIVCALGFEDSLVGRSHECDYPPSVLRLPAVSAPKVDPSAPSGEIDRQVRSLVQSGLSVYAIDAELLDALEPDVIVTQSHCEVCAVSLRDVERALCSWLRRCPQVVSLEPNCLADVRSDIEKVALALGAADRGAELLATMDRRIGEMSDRLRQLSDRPRVACVEWVEPLMAAGNWVPELIERAGGTDVLGTAGRHSPTLSREALVASAPEVVVLMPCGYDLERTCAELPLLAAWPGWADLPAVRAGRVFAADGNQFFNRPGPRLVESLEILAEILHPEAFPPRHEHAAWRRLA